MLSQLHNNTLEASGALTSHCKQNIISGNVPSVKVMFDVYALFGPLLKSIGLNLFQNFLVRNFLALILFINFVEKIF